MTATTKTKAEAQAPDIQQLPMWKQCLVYFRLVFASQPTWLDISLVMLGTLAAIAAGVPFPLMGLLFGQLVDDMNGVTCAVDTGQNAPSSYQSAITDKIVKTVIIAAVSFVLVYVYVVCWNIVSQRLAQRLRLRYVSALLRQPPGFFDSHASAGEVSSRLEGDIAAVQAGTSEKVGIVIGSLSFFVTVFVIAFAKQPRLAAMLSSMVPVFLAMALVGGALLQKYAGQAAAAIASASSLASEALSHVSVVQAFGANARLEAKFAHAMATARTAGIRSSVVAATQAGLLYFIAYSSNALAFWQGSILIANAMDGWGNGSTIGQVYTIVYLLVDGKSSCVLLSSLAAILPLLSNAAAAYLRLLRDIDAPSPIDGTCNHGHVFPVDAPAAICFRNVVFEYSSRPGEPVLRNIDVDFAPGSYTAIVGPSGSGKSTIASLMARLYDPVEGSITIDNCEMRSINVRFLRSLMGVVQQEPLLLDRSIFENIASGLVNSPKASHQHLKPWLSGNRLAKLVSKVKEGNDLASSASALGPELVEIATLVQQAAAQADAAKFISQLQDGYATYAGPRGTLVSGGQRQRIALARALIRDPKILLLDEATSALDSASERRIQEAVEAAAKGRTVVTIAHRLSTVRNAHRIIVMEAGRIVEQGTYRELMAKEDGVFSRLAKLQSVGSENEAPENGPWLASSDYGRAMTGNEMRTDADLTDKRKQEAKEDRGDREGREGREGREDNEDTEDNNDNEDTEDNNDNEEDESHATSFKGLAWLLRPWRKWLIAAMIGAVIVGCTFSAAGLIFGYTVKALNTCQSTGQRVLSMGRVFSGLMLMLAVVEFLGNLVAWGCFGLVAEKLLYSIRVLSLRSLLEQGVDWHQSRGRSPSTLLDIITKDSAAIGAFGGSTMGTVFALAVSILVAVVLSHIVAWKIALVCLVCIPVLLGSSLMQLRMLARHQERNASAFAQATAVAVEAMQSMPTIAALSLESHVMESYAALLQHPQRLIAKSAASANIWFAAASVSGTLINALAYWWGTRLMIRGEYSQTQFLIILIAMLTSAQLWGTMFSLAPEFSRARSALARIMAVVKLGSRHNVDEAATGSGEGGGTARGVVVASDVEAKAEAKTQAERPASGGVEVTFANVSFAYPKRPNHTMLNNVSLTIRPGQFCGLVGPSGAGKSTMINLIQRFYSPTSGVVSIDGRDISLLGPEFRDDIALVPQDAALFNGSVRFNVGLGARPGHDASHAQIEEACRLASIHDAIAALPDGYDSDCGPAATFFSGGQRQRLAIARALLRRPRLLLLDESTSALDAATEAALQQGLDRISRHTTVIAITHRLHTVQRAHVIFVLEHGRIVDSGTHLDLMQRSETYRVNAMQQMLHP
ncbi:hypothetical protein CDD82_5587 [Ophiocordyceps australis]|uniref:Uncharacterized protein n=1 Tax=Ophiocordyceps australis TaxID=1399860 RepID=A0A2C5ZNB1_9HYPO|nr:hypothetical protein CDD82_5587 [Ophiocordyceps australis]